MHLDFTVNKLSVSQWRIICLFQAALSAAAGRSESLGTSLLCSALACLLACPLASLTLSYFALCSLHYPILPCPIRCTSVFIGLPACTALGLLSLLSTALCFPLFFFFPRTKNIAVRHCSVWEPGAPPPARALSFNLLPNHHCLSSQV